MIELPIVLSNNVMVITTILVPTPENKNDKERINPIIHSIDIDSNSDAVSDSKIKSEILGIRI